MFRIHLSLVIFFLAVGQSAPAASAYRLIDGPVVAEVVKVIDGDTILVEAMPWPDHKVSTYVRLRGIDAPELRSKCPTFRKAAHDAKSELASLLEGERMVQLTAISGDKYFGRVVADLQLSNGTRPADHLLEAGLVEPYSGRTKAKQPCPDD
jgi:endonuclease YncB( thermonuclease family)